MRIIAVLSLLLLAGCVSTSEIVPAGKDSYMVEGAARGEPEVGESSIAALKAANAYCAKLHKVMLIRRTGTKGSAAFGGEHSQLLFSCVSQNDPEYQRPNLRRDNGVTTIEQH